jgi:S1-C subfamily serine protease
MLRPAAFLLVAVAFAVPVVAAPPVAQPPEKHKPWFVDDEEFFGDFMEKLTEFAKNEKCLNHEKLIEKMKPGKVKLAPAKAGDKALAPEEIYKLALPSVFVVGSVYKNKDKEGEWKDGLYASAWVAAPDGILVTNWHVFEDLEPGEVFGAVDHKGHVYPMIDFLGGDKVADVAVIRIDAAGLKPLPVADGYAEVGSWVGVLSHPGDNFYEFTTGAVTRYSTNKNDDGKREKWMSLTADYAGGASGAPVLNKYGAVVGMAAMTLTIDDGGGKGPKPPAPDQLRRRLLAGQPPRQMEQPVKPGDPPKVEAKPGPDGKIAPKDPAVQMIVKMAVPGPTISKLFTKSTD